MSLEIGTFPVSDVVFGKATRWNDGVLELDHDELLALVQEDPLLADSKLDIAKPGESTRVILYEDVIEPRIKVKGPGQTYPGVAGRKVEQVGTGKTHRLGNFAVTTIKDMSHLSVQEQLWPSSKMSHHPATNERFFDMSGPGATRPPYGTINHLCIVVRSPEDTGGEDRVTSVQAAGLRVADRLARTVADLNAPEREVFDLSPRPGLPNVAYAPHLASQEWDLGARSPVGTSIYGMSRLTFPWVLDPTEVFDGAIFDGGASWILVNNPVVLAAARDHGKDTNFRAVVVQRTNWSNENEKRLMANRLAHELKMLDVSGVVITTDVRGQRFLETILSVEACEKAGIKVVLLVEEEDNEKGNAPPMLLTTPELKATVSNGTGDVPTPFPPVEKIIGTWGEPEPFWYGELAPIHGRYGTRHFSDIYGYDHASYANF